MINGSILYGSKRFFSKLLGLRYKVVYKKVSDNSAIDALSRCQHPLQSCYAISVVTPERCSEIQQGYQSDDKTKLLLQ
jgi:hypothetical protein